MVFSGAGVRFQDSTWPFPPSWLLLLVRVLGLLGKTIPTCTQDQWNNHQVGPPTCWTHWEKDLGQGSLFASPVIAFQAPGISISSDHTSPPQKVWGCHFP